MTLLDLTGLTDDELMDLHARVVRLITLRDARATAETRMTDNRTVLEGPPDGLE